MPDDRTPPWLIQLRFFLMCSPVGIIAAILLAPFALPLLLGFGVTLFLFWHGTRLFTNSFVWFFDPAGYQQLQERGIDPFYNSLGAPLNNDSDTVRMFGHEQNQGNDTDELCPECWEPMRDTAKVRLVASSGSVRCCGSERRKQNVVRQSFMRPVT